MHSVASIGLGLLLAVAVFFVAWGVGAIIRKRRRGALAVLLGLGLFAAYVILLGAAAYQIGAAEMDGTTIGPRHKARLLAEGISIGMNTIVLGVPLGVLVAIVASVRKRGASRSAQ